MNYNEALQVCGAINAAWRSTYGDVVLDSRLAVKIIRELNERFRDLEWSYTHHYGFTIVGGNVLSANKFREQQELLAQMLTLNQNMAHAADRLNEVLFMLMRMRGEIGEG